MFKNIKEAIARHQRFRQTYNELQALSDRDLADIGLSRVDIFEIAKESA